MMQLGKLRCMLDANGDQIPDSTYVMPIEAIGIVLEVRQAMNDADYFTPRCA